MSYVAHRYPGSRADRQDATQPGDVWLEGTDSALARVLLPARGLPAYRGRGSAIEVR